MTSEDVAIWSEVVRRFHSRNRQVNRSVALQDSLGDSIIMLAAQRNRNLSVIPLGSGLYLVRGWDYLRRSFEREWQKVTS